MRGIDEKRPERIDTVRKRIDVCESSQDRRQSIQWKERAGKEEKRHYKKVHDELEALHIFKHRSDRRAERGKKQRDEKHEDERDRNEQPVLRTETEDHCKDEDDDALERGDGGAS